MCKFLSAILRQSGELHCRPDVTDAHEDLIEDLGLADNGRGGFVRLEFCPDDHADITTLEKYKLTLDDETRPDWLTDEAMERAEQDLRARVQRMIVTDKRSILLGRCWIVAEGAYVGRAKGCRLYVYGGTVKRIYGGTVKRIYGGTVEQIYGGTVERIDGGTVERIVGGTVGRIYGGTVERIVGGTVKRIYGGTVGQICRHATICTIGDRATVIADNRQAT